MNRSTTISNKQTPVVTGMGVIVPGGSGKEMFWEQILSGNSAIDFIKSFDTTNHRTKVAGECDINTDNTEEDRCITLARLALKEALREAQLPEKKLRTSGLLFGNAVGSTIKMESLYREMSNDGQLWEVNRTSNPDIARQAFIPSSISGLLSEEYGILGPTFNVSNGCTSGIDVLGYAANLIRFEILETAIVVASDAPISPITLACFDAIRATNPEKNNPCIASKPFDKDRSGLVLAEGAACIVLESRESASKRNARYYGSVRGFSNRMNAFHMTGLHTEAEEISKAIQAAITQSGIRKSEIDYINAHGSSTKQNDLHETNAFKKVFGKHAQQIPISSIKGAIGHSLGAAGLTEIVSCFLSFDRQIIPPTANLQNIDKELNLDFIPLNYRKSTVQNILKVGSGFGGFQSAIVLSRD